jgi:hypothetical protein
MFMSERYVVHWAKIQQFSRSTAPWSSGALRVYVLEALRLLPSAAPCVRKLDTDSALKDWRDGQAIKKGDTLILDFAVAGRNGQRFPHPDSLLLTRLLKVYQHLPFIEGLHDPLARDIAVAGLAEQLRVFGKMEGLRRALGASGTLGKVCENGVVSYLSDAQDAWVPIPPSLKLRFDSLP